MVYLPLLLARLGELVRTRRKQAGYSQEHFASKVGVHRTYMGLLERGEAPNPTVQVLDAIAQQLGLDMVDMLTLAIREGASATPPRALTAGDQETRRKPEVP